MCSSQPIASFRLGFALISKACVVVGLLLAVAPANGDRAPDGGAIYRRLCAKCHGRAGEGVKGKYDDALSGDWSVEKLARYITKNMPEDDPGKCHGPEAAAVAEFINDSFYSRAAQSRLHPARIELARLTNRQYLNTIADLLGHFGSAEKRPDGERGLQAGYFNGRGFNRDRRAVERVDRQVDFDFSSGFPDGVPAGTNGFSMQWRGSVLAEETGDYEFAVKSPNGVRLFVNDDDRAVIDATVTSGGLEEHKATIRLIGGRAYPIQLDFLKSTEKRGAISLQWRPPRGVEEPIPARCLSTARVPSTFVLITPFPADDSSVGYERGVSVSKAWDEAATAAAIDVANYVVRHLDQLSRSKPKDSDRAAKVTAFGREFVATAFRRPLTDDQMRIFVEAQLKRPGSFEDAIKRVVILALKSPQFLYLGLANDRPDGLLVAERLAYDMWDSLPDDELWRAASRGELQTVGQVTAQARRMTDDSRARAKVRAFFHHWLQVNHVDDLSKDSTAFPEFTPRLIADLRTSLNLFLDDVFWSSRSNYRDLLLADTLFLNDRLGKFYGVEGSGSADFIPVRVDPLERSGVVTHPYLLAEFSYQKTTSPIHRGVFLTRNIVGRSLKPPPMAVAFKDAEFAPHMTMREKVSELTRPQACQACHSVINPLGFSLEHYDAVGRFRTSENGRPVDAVSDYVTDDGETVQLRTARDLATFAVASDRAQMAFIEQLFHQVVKQPVMAYGPETMTRLRQSFVASEFNLRQLLVDIAVVSARHGLDRSAALSTKRKS